MPRLNHLDNHLELLRSDFKIQFSREKEITNDLIQLECANIR